MRIFPRWDRDEEIEVYYRIANGAILVDPWPFGVSSQAGYLEGCQMDGYPQVLEPVIVSYEVRQEFLD